MRFSLALVGLLAEYELEAYPARRGIIGIFITERRPTGVQRQEAVRGVGFWP